MCGGTCSEQTYCFLDYAACRINESSCAAVEIKSNFPRTECVEPYALLLPFWYIVLIESSRLSSPQSPSLVIYDQGACAPSKGIKHRR
jgi:hypothetical protein